MFQKTVRHEAAALQENKIKRQSEYRGRVRRSRKISCANLDPKMVWISSVPSSKLGDNISDYNMITAFHFLSNSLFINNTTSQRCQPLNRFPLPGQYSSADTSRLQAREVWAALLY
jgi:hypothetical protein